MQPTYINEIINPILIHPYVASRKGDLQKYICSSHGLTFLLQLKLAENFESN